MPNRRDALLALPSTLAWPLAAHAAAEPLEAIEAASGGRIGLHALDTGSGRRIGHRDGERFAMASTFKWLLAAGVLQRASAGTLPLDRPIPFGKADLVSYAPVVEEALAQHRPLTVLQLCEAIMLVSDNAAANLLLGRIGGPAGLTKWLHSLGDRATRLDRTEPALNANEPGDPRDTTTPAAMVALMKRLLLEDPLAPAARERLLGWLVECRTGARRLRAGLPSGWRAGDKTGSGRGGAINDVAIVWPPGRAPWLVACYLSGSDKPTADLEGVHARVMASVVAQFGA